MHSFPQVSWLATGIKSTTSNADVTGSAVYLLRITMAVSSGVAAGTYDGTTLGLYPRATELISSAAFVSGADGQVPTAQHPSALFAEIVCIL